MGVECRKKKDNLYKKNKTEHSGGESQNNRSRMNDCGDIRAEPLNDYCVLTENLSFLFFVFWASYASHRVHKEKDEDSGFSLIYSLAFTKTFWFLIFPSINSCMFRCVRRSVCFAYVSSNDYLCTIVLKQKIYFTRMRKFDIRLMK